MEKSIFKFGPEFICCLGICLVKSELFNKEVRSSFIESQLTLWYRYNSLGFCLLIPDLVSTSPQTISWSARPSKMSIVYWGNSEKNKSSVLYFMVHQGFYLSNWCKLIHKNLIFYEISKIERWGPIFHLSKIFHCSYFKFQSVKSCN